MSLDPITVDNWTRWGKLVKTWATGRSYFANDALPIEIEKLPLPRSLQELKNQCELVGAGVHIPDNIKELVVLTHSPLTMVVKLPPKERIEKQEEVLSQPGGSYPFPSFYEEFIDDDNLPPEDKLRAHACRIGDYTISMCG